MRAAARRVMERGTEEAGEVDVIQIMQRFVDFIKILYFFLRTVPLTCCEQREI